ncbi:hypothetical protein [Pseudoxanthomonas dokdonensis]|nr:hypothetical protein [Pseudoxanthomonas dokdonensis]
MTNLHPAIQGPLNVPVAGDYVSAEQRRGISAIAEHFGEIGVQALH